MQPLIQPISSQIIDSCFYFPERFRDFSSWKFPQEMQLLHLKTIYHLNRVFGQKFTRNAKNGFECLKLIWGGTFASFNTEPLWFCSRIGSRVKISLVIYLAWLITYFGNFVFVFFLLVLRWGLSLFPAFPFPGVMGMTRQSLLSTHMRWW